MNSKQVPSNGKTSLAQESTEYKASPVIKSNVSNYIGEVKIGEAWKENEKDSAKLGIRFIQTLGLPTFNSGNGVIEEILPRNDVSYWNCLYALPATFLGVMFSFVFTLIPYQNTIEHPSYWDTHVNASPVCVVCL